jgi:plastocyanin
MTLRLRLTAASVALAALAVALVTSQAGAGTGATAARLSTSASLHANPNGMIRFDKSRLTVRHGNVTIEMHDPSTSGLHHGIAVSGNGVHKTGRIVAPGQVSTLAVRLKRGRYTFFCPVPGHRAAGMRGTLVVK